MFLNNPEKLCWQRFSKLPVSKSNDAEKGCRENIQSAVS